MSMSLPVPKTFPPFARISNIEGHAVFSKQNSTKAWFFSLKMSKKRDVWSDKETLELLAAWGAEEIQKNLQGVHKNTDIYKKVSEMMKRKGIHRDWTQCRTKFKHLKSTYKKHKDNLARSSTLWCGKVQKS